MIHWREYLAADPAICGGQLCAKGTRVLLTSILASLAEGASSEDILRSYPSLKPEHIRAALAYVEQQEDLAVDFPIFSVSPEVKPLTLERVQRALEES